MVCESECVADAANKDFVPQVPPNLVAHVKFTPSAQDPDSDFADEVYSPLLELIANDREGYPENGKQEFFKKLKFHRKSLSVNHKRRLSFSFKVSVYSISGLVFIP